MGHNKSTFDSHSIEILSRHNCCCTAKRVANKNDLLSSFVKACALLG